MKKIFISASIVASLLIASTGVFSQEINSSGFENVKGKNFLNAGIGLGSFGLSGAGGLPITASFEHGFTKNISAGINAGLIKRSFATDWKYTYLLLGVRGSYHLNEVLKIGNPDLDVYAGAGLTYRRYKIKYGSDLNEDYYGKASGGDMTINIHAGGRYFFTQGIGAFAEIGYGISPLQIGVTIKL